MKRNIKKISLLSILFLFCFFMYQFIERIYFSPVYRSKDNVGTILIKGKTYAIHYVYLDGKTYVSEPITNPDKFSFGQQIGRTKDGMRIYKAKGYKERLMLTGFMSPPVMYKEQE